MTGINAIAEETKPCFNAKARAIHHKGTKSTKEKRRKKVTARPVPFEEEQIPEINY